MTVFKCERCGERVSPGKGYIHSNRIGQWRVDHTGCYPMFGETCFAIPAHWSDLLSAHCEYVNRQQVPA